MPGPTWFDYGYFFWELISGMRTRRELEAARLRDAQVAPYLDLRQPLVVLDLANGELQPQTQILKRRGYAVVGIDLVNRPEATWTISGRFVRRLYQFARWLFALHLPIAPTPVEPVLLCANAAKLPFGAALFDLVTSTAAFEHFLDVPAVIAELYRVTRPGGVVFTSIHLFTSLSGGHNVQLMALPMNLLPDGVEPWDHLRQRRLPFHVPLNQWRVSQYLAAFANYFEIVAHYCHVREGEALLTPQLEAELGDYSRDELTCGEFVIVARRPR